jgi:hypothetical protein
MGLQTNVWLLFIVLGQVPQLVAIETLDFSNISQLLFTIILLSLGGFLSHFLFWLLFGPLAICVALLILTFVVSCVTNEVLAFLCMESSSMHSTTFIISWHVAGTSLLCKMVL